jgi:hypothetical protein
MNAEEYREKEGFTDANFWTGSEIDFDSIYEFAEDYHNAKLKLLDIPIVSKSVAKQYAEFCVRNMTTDEIVDSKVKLMTDLSGKKSKVLMLKNEIEIEAFKEQLRKL